MRRGLPDWWPDWWPDAALGAAVAGFAVVEASRGATGFAGSSLLVALGMGLAVGFWRRSPGLALSLVWVACSVQVLWGLDVMLVQVAVLLVSYGAARYGSPAVLWASGLSIPAGAAIAVAFVVGHGTRFSWFGIGVLGDAFGYGGRLGFAVLVGGLLVLLILSAPWLVGLTLRIREQAQASRVAQVTAEEGRSQAEEIARLRAEQATLARDVHDVVGHSLAVILAQAESAQFLEEADTGALRQTMANIATSARTSLQDVRKVLTSSSGEAPAAQPGGLDSLIEGVRAGGHDVVSSVVGTPQPLPPELDVVAFRVLQEMLTNAIRHGVRGEPVLVERHWEGELRIEVRNRVAPADETIPLAVRQPAQRGQQGQQGQGLVGMRRRLESVGGRLDVRRRDEPGGATFTTTAWVPLRAVSG